MHDLIELAVPKEYLAEITDNYTGLAHLTIQKILTHVKSKGAELKDLDSMPR